MKRERKGELEGDWEKEEHQVYKRSSLPPSLALALPQIVTRVLPTPVLPQPMAAAGTCLYALPTVTDVKVHVNAHGTSVIARPLSSLMVSIGRV